MRHGCTHRLRTNRDGWSGIFQRQVQRERAAFAGRAAQVNLATEQVREFAADRKAKARAAVFAAGAGIGLLERLEDELLLLKGNTDAGVGDLECDHRRSGVEDWMVDAPAA